jgi:hypothetical protein
VENVTPNRPKIRLVSEFDHKFEAAINAALADDYIIAGQIVFNVVDGRIKVSTIMMDKTFVEAQARRSQLANMNPMMVRPQ